MTGTIKKLMKDKGFGFIAREDAAKDVFFHSNSLVGVQFTSLNEGDAVSFDVEESPKGLNAINVKRV
ncbi:MAG: cold shock domain-containing protein [Candidatus Vogelbacteria bacterium]|nr:cold shock domain-containing protein [Candidatus Vogelbacteria bacterium]